MKDVTETGNGLWGMCSCSERALATCWRRVCVCQCGGGLAVRQATSWRRGARRLLRRCAAACH
eukprot:scaffold7500_cov127-Isochrysis_galbana.AAC.21